MNSETEAKRERGRGRLYHQQGSALWWMAFYKRGKQIRMSTGETDEKKAERALKLKLQERDAELGGGRKMITPGNSASPSTNCWTTWKVTIGCATSTAHSSRVI